jgi:hypothetical protein
MQTHGFKDGHGYKHRHTWDALRTIFRANGLRGWFRGISLNYIKAFPQVAISFTTFETVKKFLIRDDTTTGGSASSPS